MDYFKHVFNVQDEYMTNNKDYVIIETTLTEKSDTPYDRMVSFCDERISSSWSVGMIKGYDTITFRMWDKSVAKEFVETFKNCIKRN